MDKVIGNYTTQANMDFPLDCETLQYLADNEALVQVLGNIGGDKIILSGCSKQAGNRTAGYVFLRTKDYPEGEVLRFAGGAGDAVCVQREDVAVTADGYDYNKAYTKRSLKAGTGDGETYYWDDFVTVETNRALAQDLNDLRTQMESLVGEPLGIIKMWAGKKLPEGYVFCDGEKYSAEASSDFYRLYQAIGNTFNQATAANGQKYTTEAGFFRVPDLRGRFIVGRNDMDGDYNQNGLSGGEKKHLLTPEETARVKHSHSATASEEGGHTHAYNDVYFSERGGDVQLPIREGKNGSIGSNDTDYDNSGFQFGRTTENAGAHSHTITVADSNQANATASHENRPPYYVLAYIMRYK